MAEPGSTTAFIGSTGSGKSTILNLIPRFYDATAGQVLVDGVDVRRLRQKDLRSRIGYVPQTNQLFSGTVAANIAYGHPNMPAEDLEKVAEVAQALGFIRQLGTDQDAVSGPEASGTGLDFVLAQDGGNISGGQRQRLAIARALAVRPDIFLFDDSFSALDYATDAALRKELANYTQNSTVIIVTQRVSTIMNAEKILVIDAGQVVGSGTHAQLLQSCQQYREIAASQLSSVEMEGSAA